MKKIVLMLMAMVVFGNVFATEMYTDSNPWGVGVPVENVWVDFEGKQVCFMSVIGGIQNYYLYKWNTSSVEITANAKAVYALLLSAQANGKNVSILYDDTNTVVHNSTSVTNIIKRIIIK